MRPRAYVLGNLDLVRPLASVGVECVAVAPHGAPVTRSRLVTRTVPWEHTAPDEVVVEALCDAAATEPTPPVLYFGTDRALLLVSRHRDRLGQHLRFVVDERDLVEQLVDKRRFRRLADRLGLPVPPSVRFRPGDGPPPPLPYPCVLKPLTRDLGPWVRLFQRRKVVLVRDEAALLRLLPLLAEAGQEVVAQRHVPGPESAIESWHAWVAPDGEQVGFTGRKIRTWPPQFGNSTALVTTDAPDVRELGRQVVRRLRLRGVAKVDVKRDRDGRLWLLEVNPRFSLWHHLGARAGVNLPALVHAALAGLPRPAVGPARPGVSWVHPHDALAHRADPTTSTAAWLRFAAGSDCRSTVALDDPWPTLGRLVPWHRRSDGAAPLRAPSPEHSAPAGRAAHGRGG